MESVEVDVIQISVHDRLVIVSKASRPHFAIQMFDYKGRLGGVRAMETVGSPDINLAVLVHKGSRHEVSS